MGKGVKAISLDWLLEVLLIGWRGGERRAAGLIPSAYPSRPLSPHSPLTNSHPSPPSTSI